MRSLKEFRTDAPVTPEQYKYIDEAVKIAARQAMVGRRLLPVYGPLGFGKDAVTYDKLTEVSNAQINLAWKVAFSEDIVNLTRTTLPVPVLSKAFRINRRSLEASRTVGTPLDVATAKSAAYKVALLEDQLIILGYAADGSNYDIKGLYNAANNDYSSAADWGTASNIVTSINGAINLLINDNIYPPYNLVLNPTQWSEAGVLISNTGISYRQWIRETIGGEIFVTPTITAGTGMMLAAGDRGFFDLAVGVDLTTELEQLDLSKGRDLFGLVYECVVPRIWETNAICKLSSI